MIYAELYGKGKGTYDGDERRQDTDSDSKDDDIEGYDGFAGDININNALQIESV